jgi:hypothetical protein
MSKWIKFVEKEIPGNKKTLSWYVENTKSGTVVGWVHWHTGFRKYSFYPEDNMVFDVGCLRAIADFCDEKTKTHLGYKKVR